MKREEIMQLIKDLAKSQGSYGRMLRSINELDEHDYNKLMSVLEEQQFKDPVDFVMFIEG